MKIQRYILLVNAALTALVLWGAYSSYRAWLPDRQRMPLVAMPGGASTIQETQSSQRMGLAQYQDVILHDIFGTAAQKRAGIKVDAPKAEEKIQLSRRNFQLKGTVVGPGKRGSYAVISDGKGAEGDVYRVNDLLQNARIVEILPDRVILDAEGRREALVLTYELGIGEKKSAGSTQPKSRSPQPPAR